MRRRSSRAASVIARSSAAVLLVAVAVAACSQSTPPTASPASSSSLSASDATPSAAASLAPVGGESTPASSLTIADAATCPVTQPGKAPAEIGERMFGSGSAVGNDDLWVGGLGPGGVIAADPRFVESDGSIGWKLGWWRIAPGMLTIEGGRLDADAPQLRAVVPEGYGLAGFQATGVYFTTEGCWKVSGTVGSSTLTFVTFVIRT